MGIPFASGPAYALSIFVILLLRFNFAEVVISYHTTNVGRDCDSYCEASALQCFDNIIEDMSCYHAASQICGTSDLEDMSGSYHCDRGGCYVNCREGIYASRGTQYWTCYTEPICHLTSTSGYHSFYQVCPCAYEIKEDTGIHLYLWQFIGVGLFVICCALGVVQLLAIFFPNLFPSK